MTRKVIKKESDYHGKVTLQYSLAIPVILHGFPESSKVSLSEKNIQRRTPQFGSRGSEGFKSRFCQHVLCDSQQKFRRTEI